MATFGVGTILRQERVRQGLLLGDIAIQTRIAQRFLEAIEAEEFSRLPGLIFTRNFVRQYAEALHLDPAPLLTSLPKVNLEPEAIPDPPGFVPSPHRDYARLTGMLSTLMWLGLAGVASLGAYVYFNPKHPVPIGKSVAMERSLPSVNSPQSETPDGNPVPVPPPSASPQPESSSSPAVVSGHPTDPLGLPVQVVLKATEDSWVQIVADGKTAFTGILHPNDSRAVEANALVKVTAGNAGGVEISLNGKSLDPLGPSGQVRTVRLTADGPPVVLKTAPL